MIPSPHEQPAVKLIELELASTASPSGVLLSGPAESAALLHRLIGRSDREEFVALLVNVRHRVTHAHRVARGTLTSTCVHPREVFKAAILANAAAIVVGHNHPSGDPHESGEDARVATRLREAGTLLGIELLDALIVTPNGAYYSASECRVGQVAVLQAKEVADGP